MAAKKINHLLSLFGILIAALLGGCEGSPTSGDVIGTWANLDGAELTLEENGQFSARSLPRAIFWWNNPGPSFGANGTWKLEKGKHYWEVKLSFDEILGRPNSRGISVLVSGSGDSTYLFQWKGEEGEARYKLERKLHAR